jgi:hypothetical protein
VDLPSPSHKPRIVIPTLSEGEGGGIPTSARNAGVGMLRFAQHDKPGL